MNVDSMTRIAGLIGERGRIRMLATLLDGGAHSATELAMAADVSPQTASSHLSKLAAGELIRSERCGRQRFFRLKSAEVAAAIEALGALAQGPPQAVPEVRFARTCYDHLAGMLSIAVIGDILKRGVLRRRGDELVLTPAGEDFLLTLGIDVQPLRRLRRAFVRPCLDWTERHHHIGGAIGAALLARFFEMGWLAHIRGSRAVRVTAPGERAFERVFGIRCSALASPSRSAGA
jgi:DNA-binding transcriptional ArsR family regulator